MEELMENMIGNRIKERRKALNITQTQIQQKTSISSGNLSCIENGKYLPSAVALLELSQILDCSIDCILTGKSSISEPLSILDKKESDFLHKFKELSTDDQDEIMAIINIKLQKARKNVAKSSNLTITDNEHVAG